MKQTTNYNLNKPDNTDTVNIEIINNNMDILDAEIKKVNNKAETITVPVTSVNNKTGNVVLNSSDVKMTDGTTLENAINENRDSIKVITNQISILGNKFIVTDTAPTADTAKINTFYFVPEIEG